MRWVVTELFQHIVAHERDRQPRDEADRVDYRRGGAKDECETALSLPENLFRLFPCTNVGGDAAEPAHSGLFVIQRSFRDNKGVRVRADELLIENPTAACLQDLAIVFRNLIGHFRRQKIRGRFSEHFVAGYSAQFCKRAVYHRVATFKIFEKNGGRAGLDHSAQPRLALAQGELSLLLGSDVARHADAAGVLAVLVEDRRHNGESWKHGAIATPQSQFATPSRARGHLGDDLFNVRAL